MSLIAAMAAPAKSFALTAAAAKYIAIAMAYDDVIRIADLKTRRSRYDRVLRENSVGDGQIVYTTEYMHPRLEEVAGTMPAPLGRFIEGNPTLFGWAFRKGRRVRSGTHPLVSDALCAFGTEADPPHDAATQARNSAYG